MTAPGIDAVALVGRWKDLYREVVSSGLCTGCAACVVACPHDVLDYRHQTGGFRPFHIERSEVPDYCSHGERGCTSCTRACPRFRGWEAEAEMHVFGERRNSTIGVHRTVALTRASDAMVKRLGQDGGTVTTMLAWALEHGYIDGALTSFLPRDHRSQRPRPGVARSVKDLLDASGSRYTLSANLLALPEAEEAGLDGLALVGTGCQTSAPPIMWARQAGKPGQRIVLTVGLLCSKTFDDSIFAELLSARYGIDESQISRIDIKGELRVWTLDGRYRSIPLSECHPWTRPGCRHCPDFSAEHADISAGGIGALEGWTLTVTRTELGDRLLAHMLADGALISRPVDDDPEALRLLHRLALMSRQRWPSWAEASVALPDPTATPH